MAFSPDGKTLAWTGSGTINLWDMATQSLVAVYEIPAVSWNNSLAFSPDGKTFVTVDAHYDIVKVWDINTGNTIDLGGHVELAPISFSIDSTMLATGGTRGVKLWDVNTGDNLANIAIEPRSRVRLVSFSPDRETLAYRVSGEKFTRLWDVTTQTQTGIIENPSVEYWAFSPDGKTLASAAGRIITLWDVVTGQPVATLEGPLRRVGHITYSPDGNTLASTSLDHTVRLWDIATKQNIETFEGDSRYVAFSPDGTLLVFHKLNVGVKVWNRMTRTMATIDEDYFMAFLPDSSMMILRNYSFQRGETISVWDAKTSTFIAALNPLIFKRFKQSIFSPDGKTLAITRGGSTTLFEPEVIYNQLPLFALSKLLKISGDNQKGVSNAVLSDPFVVEVQDENGSAPAGISVTFAVTGGGGILSTKSTTTDANGRAQSTLTLGPNLGTNTVEVSAAGIEGPVTFHAISESPPITADVNGDGNVNILDLVLVAYDLGNTGTNLAADVSGDGVVNILDLVLVAGMFGDGAAAPSAHPQVPETLTAVEGPAVADRRDLDRG